MPKMKQSGSKKTRLTPRQLSHDREAGGNDSAGAMNLLELAPKRRNEEQEIDLDGDTGTSSDENMEDETYVDPNVYRVKHHGKGPATDDEEEDDEDEDVEEDLGGQERDEDDDPMDDDDDDDDGTCRSKAVKPIYMFPNKSVKYHGIGMTKKLQKLRDKDPYASKRTTSDRRFWATFQQDYYATVIIKKPKITHMAHKDYPKLHDGGLLEPKTLYFMYPRDQRANVGHVRGLYT
jgi:hypothetical protein